MSKWYWIFFNDSLYNKELSDKEFRFLCAISNLCAETGECRAWNKYFTDRFDIQPETVTRNIKSLEKMGFINIRYTWNWTAQKKRFISLTNWLLNREPIDSKVNVNNTIISNDINNNNINILLLEKQEKSNVISLALNQFKNEVTKRNKMFVPNSKMDRINISNLSKNKDVIKILEQKQFDLCTFISKVFLLADSLEFWKEHIIDNTTTFYRNYIKILNQSSVWIKKEKTQEETIKEQEILNNMFN